MSTFRTNETPAHWIGYQVITGFGLGFGMQGSALTAQIVLAPHDVSIGMAIMFFSQQLGGAVFTSVGQNILTSRLASQISDIPGIDPSKISSQGASDLLTTVAPQFRNQVKEAYNTSVTRIFLCGMGLALGALVSSMFLEWKSIKKGPGGQPTPEATQQSQPLESGSKPISQSPSLKETV